MSGISAVAFHLEKGLTCLRLVALYYEAFDFDKAEKEAIDALA